MYSLSTCWNSHRHTDGAVMLREIRDLGFEYAELSHGIRISLLPGILQAVDAGENRGGGITRGRRRLDQRRDVGLQPVHAWIRVGPAVARGLLVERAQKRRDVGPSQQ